MMTEHPPPPAEEALESYRQIDRLAVFVNHGIVALMCYLIGMAVLHFATRLTPGWQGGYLPWVCLLVALEGMYTWRRVKIWRDLNIYGFTYWLIEWVILTLLLKLFLYTLRGFEQFFRDIQTWGTGFIFSFFDAELVFVLLVSLGIWLVAGMFARDLWELEGSDIFFDGAEVEILLADRSLVRRRLVARVFGIGFLMAFLTAMLYVDFRTLHGIPYLNRSDVLHVVIYFFLAFVLLSQTQFALLRGTWSYNKIPVQRGMGKAWTIFSAIFLAGLALVAFALPTRYSVGLLGLLNYTGSLLLMVLYYFEFLILIPALRVIGWILNLIGIKTEASQPAVSNLPPPMQWQPEQTPLPWLEVLKSVIFWAFVLGIVGFAVHQYVRQNISLLEKLRAIPLLSWLSAAIQGLLGVFSGFRRQVGLAIQAGTRRLRPASLPNPPGVISRFLSLRRLNPRQKVLFFYLAMIRRGSESGLPRRPDQTPGEYARVLEQGIGEVEQEVEGLTEAFVEARYSRHPVEEARVGLVKAYWERVRSRLKRRRAAV